MEKYSVLKASGRKVLKRRQERDPTTLSVHDDSKAKEAPAGVLLLVARRVAGGPLAIATPAHAETHAKCLVGRDGRSLLREVRCWGEGQLPAASLRGRGAGGGTGLCPGHGTVPGPQISWPEQDAVPLGPGMLKRETERVSQGKLGTNGLSQLFCPQRNGKGNPISERK